uniref:Uncharacterized protein n=1 Tax=Oryza rufipogon TaxID=4529 RepID=A0A0E0RH56_ORYRU
MSSLSPDAVSPSLPRTEKLVLAVTHHWPACLPESLSAATPDGLIVYSNQQSDGAVERRRKRKKK